jgi:hypothetical protein
MRRHVSYNLAHAAICVCWHLFCCFYQGWCCSSMSFQPRWWSRAGALHCMCAELLPQQYYAVLLSFMMTAILPNTNVTAQD